MSNPIVTIEMEDGGIIRAELYPEIAPNTVRNFVSLVKKGFYDGVIFHRVIPGFMIQGGDPTGTGMGGPATASRASSRATASKTTSSTPAACCPWPAPWIRTPPAASFSSCTWTPRTSTSSMPRSAK